MTYFKCKILKISIHVGQHKIADCLLHVDPKCQDGYQLLPNLKKVNSVKYYFFHNLFDFYEKISMASFYLNGTSKTWLNVFKPWLKK